MRKCILTFALLFIIGCAISSAEEVEHLSIQIDKPTITIGETITATYDITGGTGPISGISLAWFVYGENGENIISVNDAVISDDNRHGTITFTPTFGKSCFLNMLAYDKNGCQMSCKSNSVVINGSEEESPISLKIDVAQTQVTIGETITAKYDITGGTGPINGISLAWFVSGENGQNIISVKDAIISDDNRHGTITFTPTFGKSCHIQLLAYDKNGCLMSCRSNSVTINGSEEETNSFKIDVVQTQINIGETITATYDITGGTSPMSSISLAWFVTGVNGRRIISVNDAVISEDKRHGTISFTPPFGKSCYLQLIANDKNGFEKSCRSSPIVINQFSLYYNSNDEKNNTLEVVVKTLDECVIRNNIFSREGYYIDSWNTAGDGTGKKYKDGDKYQGPYSESTITLYAQWMKRTVAFDANGGTGKMDDVFLSGTSYVLPDNSFTAPDGYVFSNWQISGKDYKIGDHITVNESIVVKAIWKEKHLIQFDKNGGTGQMEDVQTSDDYYILPSNEFIAPEGKIFAHWQIGDKEYAVGDTVTVSSDIQIKAIWDETENADVMIEKHDLDAVPQELRKQFSNVNQLKMAIFRYIYEQNFNYNEKSTLYFNVTLMVKLDGKHWAEATVENFPSEGIRIRFDYPQGTNGKDYEFKVAHMFTHGSPRLGIQTGQVEVPTVTVEDDGIWVTLRGLSPVAISWVKKSDMIKPNLPQTGDISNILLYNILLGTSIILMAIIIRKRIRAR